PHVALRRGWVARPCSAPPRCPPAATAHVPSLHRRRRSSPNGPGRYRPVAPRRVVLASRAGGPCSRSTCSARSACPLRSASDRSARRRTHACAGLCTPRSTLWAVELRREKSRRRPQDRVRPAQLTHFLLQFDQALGLASRGSGTVSLVDLRLHDPIPQGLGIDPELLAHTTERARPRRWIPSRLNSHPRGSLPKLVRVLPRCCHAPHPPVDSEPPPDPGRFSFSRHESVQPEAGRATYPTLSRCAGAVELAVVLWS